MRQNGLIEVPSKTNVQINNNVISQNKIPQIHPTFPHQTPNMNQKFPTFPPIQNPPLHQAPLTLPLGPQPPKYTPQPSPRDLIPLP